MKLLNILNYIRIALIFVLVTVVIYLCFVLYGAVTEDSQEEKQLELFYMYGNKTGSYFLEPQAEYENLIYVSQSDLNDWDITPTEPGQKFTGIFDPTGWDLITLKHKEEN